MPGSRFREAISLPKSKTDISLNFNYELCGVIGRALASYAIDPGSNPGHAMLSFFKFVNFYWVTTGYHGLPRVTMGYHGLFLNFNYDSSPRFSIIGP